VTQAMTRRGMVPLALGAAAACGLVLPAHAGDGGGGEDVSATEDLMREHGVLRRTLIVYAELVPRLRSKPEAVDAGALAEAAALFRTFGEDYHERSLEEQYVFPEVGGAGATLPASSRRCSPGISGAARSPPTSRPRRGVAVSAQGRQSRLRGRWRPWCACTRLMRPGRTRCSSRPGRSHSLKRG
jgi:hypothetical protein